MSHCSLRGKKGKGHSRRRTRRKSEQEMRQRARRVLSKGIWHPVPGILGLSFKTKENQKGRENIKCVMWPLEDGLERNKVGGREIKELFTSIYKQETGEKVLDYCRM